MGESRVDRLDAAGLLVTERLHSRMARASDLRAELDAFRELASLASTDAEKAIQRFLELAVHLCPSAGSAGLSEIQSDEDGQPIFRWTAMAGEYAPYVGGKTPRDFSPCGLCLDRGRTILVDRPARVFTYLADAHRPIVEGLIVPLGMPNPLGTIWIVSHSDEVRGFDRTDAQVVESLAAQLFLTLDLQRMRRRLDPGDGPRERVPEELRPA
jgi:GAF domain-containing protein